MTFLFHMGSLFGETGRIIYANSYTVIFKQLYAKWWCLHRSIWMVVAKCRPGIMWTSPYCSIGIDIKRTPRSCLLKRNMFVPLAFLHHWAITDLHIWESSVSQIDAYSYGRFKILKRKFPFWNNMGIFARWKFYMWSSKKCNQFLPLVCKDSALYACVINFSHTL